MAPRFRRAQAGLQHFVERGYNLQRRTLKVSQKPLFRVAFHGVPMLSLNAQHPPHIKSIGYLNQFLVIVIIDKRNLRIKF